MRDGNRNRDYGTRFALAVLANHIVFYAADYPPVFSISFSSLSNAISRNNDARGKKATGRVLNSLANSGRRSRVDCAQKCAQARRAIPGDRETRLRVSVTRAANILTDLTTVIAGSLSFSGETITKGGSSGVACDFPRVRRPLRVARALARARAVHVQLNTTCIITRYI